MPVIPGPRQREYMSDKNGHENEILGDHSITETLARQTNTPVETVAEIYAKESAELEQTARIKNFIRVIATRRTRVVLVARTATRS